MDSVNESFHGDGLEINEATCSEQVFVNMVLRMFPASEFALIHPYDGSDPHLRETRDPDLKFRDILSGEEFWIACRFCPEARFDRVKWCDGFQLDRYRWFQDKVRPLKVYVVIGVGGWARGPRHVYCIPIDKTMHTVLWFDTLRKHEHAGAFVYTDRLR